MKSNPLLINESCLYDKVTKTKVPLKSVIFNVNIFNTRFAVTYMKQSYVNESKDKTMETIFYFPTDSSYSLSKILIDYVDLDDPEKIISVETCMEERKKAEIIYH